MDKLTRYNQKLLAILGTIVVIFAGGMLLIGLGVMIFEWLDDSVPAQHGVQVQQVTVAEDGATTIKRTQEITFYEPKQLDTAEARFIIPVGQVNLQTPERVAMESGRGLKLIGSSYSYHSYSGTYNNFIFSDYNLGVQKRLFDERIAISRWAYLKVNGHKVLMFIGSTEDVNKDKRINDDDFASLFVYYIDQDEMKRYDFPQSTVLDYTPLKKTDHVAIQIGFDKDNDLEFESDQESKQLFLLDLNTRQTQPLLDKAELESMQKLLDGVDY